MRTTTAEQSGPARRVLLTLVAALLVLPQVALPATITVGGACTLPDAITAANTDAVAGSCSAGAGADTVELTADVTLTAVDNYYSGYNGLPVVSTDITVAGGSFTIERDAAAPDFRIFAVDSSGTLTLDDVTVTGGESGSSYYYGGGGVLRFSYFGSGGLTITNSTISGNSAYYGGGILNREGYDYGSGLTITDSTISDNSTGAYDGGGAGIWVRSRDSGGTTITNSTISGNTAYYGGGVSSSTFGSSSTNLTNSTISGNTATSYYGGGVYARGAMALTNTTFSGNSSTPYGGSGILGDATFTLTNTILGNSPSGYNCGSLGGLVDNGGNFDDDGSCGGFPLLTGLDATLADNGGPTATHALLAGSSAIDAAGDCTLVDPALATDQRGAPRVGDCDSGAFEFGSVPPGEGFTCDDVRALGDLIRATDPGEFVFSSYRVIMGYLADAAARNCDIDDYRDVVTLLNRIAERTDDPDLAPSNWMLPGAAMDAIHDAAVAMRDYFQTLLP